MTSLSLKFISWLSAKQVIMEIILAILAGFAGIVKFLSLPGGDEMLMIAMLTLAGFYFLVGLFHTSETKVMQIPLHVFGIASSICVIGLLFTFLQLPGAQEQLLIGAISLAVSALILIMLAATGRSKKLLPVLIRLVVLGGLSLNALIGLSNFAG